MKRKLSMILTLLLVIGMVSAVPFVQADTATLLNITGGLDLTAYSQNAMRVYFDKNITNVTENITMANIQAMADTDPNYSEPVVSGVLDGVSIDGKTVRQWNTDSQYAAMIHFYTDNGQYFIAVYIDATLVNFSDGNPHTVSVNSKFKAYDLSETNGAALVMNPSTKSWTPSRINVTQGLDLTGYNQNALRIYVDKNLTPITTDITMNNIQAIASGAADYDRTVVEGVKDGISIDGKTVREWNTGSDYCAMVHFFTEGTQYYIALYIDETVVDFNDGNEHTVSVNGNFKNYAMDAGTSATLYLEPTTMNWSTTAPLPGMNVTGGDSRPTFDWGNTMRVLLDQPLWVPDPAAVSPEKDLLVDAQNLKSGDKYYDDAAVDSILNKIIIDGKTVAEWNALQAGTAQVHVGPSENDLRIYMSSSSVVFGDGNTHIVTIEKNFISFSGYKTEEAVSLHYDPTAKTWGTAVVVPPTPAPGEPVDVFTATPVMMSDKFGTAYFYSTNVITRAPTINVQAGGTNIPQRVQDAVLDLIKVDGKTVREWNVENDTDYAVMVSFETEQNGSDTFGRLGFFIDTTSTCGFTPDKDHVVEFLPGLIGLNDAPIGASKWEYKAADMDWYQVTWEVTPTEEATPTEDATPTDTTGSEPTVTGSSSQGEIPATSDNGMPVIFLALALTSGMLFFVIKKRGIAAR